MSTEDIYWKEDVSKKFPQYHHRYASSEHKLLGKLGICARVVEDPDKQITNSQLKRLRDGGGVGYSLNKQKRWEWFVPEVLLHEEEFRDQAQVYFREESVDTNIWGSFQRVKKLHYLDDSKDEVKSMQLRGAQNTRDARIQLSGVFEGSKKDAKGNEIEKVAALPRVSYVRRTCLPLSQLPVKRFSQHIKWKKNRWYTDKKEIEVPYEIEDLDESDFEDHYYYDWEDPTEKRPTTLYSLVDYVKKTKNNSEKKKKKRTESPLEENSWEIVSLASSSDSFISDLNEDIEFVEEQENQIDYPKALKLCELPLESPSKRRIRARPKHFANPGNFKGMGIGRCSVYTDLDEEYEVKAGTRVVECIGCSTRLVVPLSNSPAIRCAECKIGFCSQCGWEPHCPLSCDENREWCRRFDIQLGMKIHEDDIEKQLKRLICHCGAVTEFGDKNPQTVCSICHKLLVNATPRRYNKWFSYPICGSWWKIPTPETDNVVHKGLVIDSVKKISLIDKRFSEMAILGHCWRMDDKKVIELQRAIKNLPYAKGKEALKQIILKGLYTLEYGAASAYQNRQLKSSKQRITWEKLQKLHEQILLLLLNAKYVDDPTSNCAENIERLVDFFKFD